ncbi:YhcN/YlaJ family sporulation lipoprotein [Bacillus sp. FJAT-49736]|uniref:YhcN/YlaJ family sporulation lipoprotein n=1 Tax=Bacillus sp. FJAT-49736 TaxID=2833582 RepID=UPI001BC9188E|nr:YhcN/YlaJ family sporulation lipoprotein [Bacillus sp. FJAT-49736]MBS4173853.1 YhcN/YlaJ family sporulation lipoprotein [Bacillus sp. FJAT-49736]
MLKFVKTVISIGIASSLLLGCTNNNNGKSNVSPVRYNPNTNTDNNNNMDRVSYNDNLGPGANVNYRNRTDNLGTDVSYNRYNNRGNYRIAKEAADRVANLKEVDRANVLVTGNNAYVAVLLDDRSRNELPRTFKNKISNEVRKADNSIDNVYVTTNPDFYDRVTDYGRELQSGHPVRGLYDQISGTIKRVFPNNR